MADFPNNHTAKQLPFPDFRSFEFYFVATQTSRLRTETAIAPCITPPSATKRPSSNSFHRPEPT